ILFILFSLICLGSCVAYWRTVDRVSNKLRARLGRSLDVFRFFSREGRQFAFWTCAYFFTLTSIYVVLASVSLIQPVVDIRMSRFELKDGFRIGWAAVFLILLVVTSLSALKRALYAAVLGAASAPDKPPAEPLHSAVYANPNTNSTPRPRSLVPILILAS